MMSRIFILAVAAALIGCGTTYAMEPTDYGYGSSYDPWNVPAPSGLRFAGSVQTVRTSSMENFGGHGGAYAGGGCCDGCGGFCVHWTQLPWTASWDGHGHYGKHGGCGNGCGY
jgi:hypothetical protein